MDAASWATTQVASHSNNSRLVPKSLFVTATVSLSGPSETETVYTASGNGDFLLTQVCVSPVNVGIRLAATGFGPIAELRELCTTFTPVMLIPPRSGLTCTTSSSEPTNELRTGDSAGSGAADESSRRVVPSS
jgi:hypothetical protein